MCGINGIIHFDENRRVNDADLALMRDVLAHRGPDDKGSYIYHNVGLGHRRLSILDTSSAGHQPFTTADGRFTIVFNGEIYNYKEFYAELKAKGVSFKSSSDTEVLLYLYQFYGTGMLSRLNGMFAFAIYDTIEKELLLVRDRMGVKPLTYAFHNNSFYFASEQKALFVAGVPLQLCENGLQEYFFNRFVAGANTLFEGVRKLLPGHYMKVKFDGTTETKRWWNLSESIQNFAPIADPEEWFLETFYDSVKLRMVSDVPVGILLSGGLDSSSVLASLHHQQFKDIQTFNIGFSSSAHNESHLAKMLADSYDYPFNSMKMEGDELFDLVNEVGWYNGEPLMHLNEAHLLGISRLAKSKVSVLLSGEGADEIMGGYVRYKALGYGSLLPVFGKILSMGFVKLNHRLDKLKRYAALETVEQKVMYNGSNLFPNELSEKLGLNTEPTNSYRHTIYKEAAALYPKDSRRQAMYFDQHTYLCSLMHRNDRTTMGAGIECREPYLDPRLVAGLGTLDSKWFFTGKKSKYILKRAMTPRLPDAILQFKKVGLSVPWGQYLLENERFVHELDELANSELFALPIISHIDVKALVKQFRSGNSRLLDYIMPLLNLNMWWKEFQARSNQYRQQGLQVH
ncbi:MAG TPA: asparagine synthase (glutamine-hydrolyzing) [Phnomibacter sp.]|nr:asparagine synthase (glutamine-hydrolyzing) [Phnomibacter sp.]